MKMVIAHDGGCAVVRLAGRLDGESADQLSETLDRLLREGQRSVLLDMGEVTYLSSPGAQLLSRVYQEFSSLRGELRVGATSAPVLDALSLADLEAKLVIPAGDPEVLPRMRASFAALRAIDLTRDSWRTPAGVPFRGAYEGTRREPDGALTCRVYARAHPVEFPETTFGLGVGALGAASAECTSRYGELAAAAGAVVYLPTEGAQVPDFELGLGARSPSAVLASGLVCEGTFSQLARFSTQPDAEAVPLGELARVCLEAVGGDTLGLVMLAETAGLVGAWLRRSPGTSPSVAFDVEGVRQWLGTTPEPAYEGTTALVVGVASRAPDPVLAPQLRPVGDGSGLVGHFHAAAFTYRPVPQRTMALRVLVTKLFAQQRVRGLLHLLSDDRGAAGAGESQFRRGLCWAAPVTRVIAAE